MFLILMRIWKETNEGINDLNLSRSKVMRHESEGLTSLSEFNSFFCSEGKYCVSNSKLDMVVGDQVTSCQK